MERLNFDNAMSDELVEVTLDGNQFNLLWETGLFQELNYELEIMIDDFEDESITDLQELGVALEITKSYKKHRNSSAYDELEGLLMLAISWQTGIYFFF